MSSRSVDKHISSEISNIFHTETKDRRNVRVNSMESKMYLNPFASVNVFSKIQWLWYLLYFYLNKSNARTFIYNTLYFLITKSKLKHNSSKLFHKITEILRLTLHYLLQKIT